MDLDIVHLMDLVREPSCMHMVVLYPNTVALCHSKLMDLAQEEEEVLEQYQVL
jgi:hypothetical protein